MKPLIRWNRERISRGVDNLMGAHIWQLSSAPSITRNIYGEQLYASADGSRIALMRCHSPNYRDPMEVWVCDFESGTTAPVCKDAYYTFASNPYCDTLFFVRRVNDSDFRLVRLDLKTLEQEDVYGNAPLPISRGTISRDEKYFVAGVRLRDNLYGLYRLDLTRGTCEVFYENEYMCNPHVQFEPSASRDLLVQINRDQRIDEAGVITRPQGWCGITLCIIDRDGGNPRLLPVGGEHRAVTGRPTGHECWIGDSGRVLLTTDLKTIYSVTPGDEQSHTVAKGLDFNHISSSADGRFFVADDFSNGRLYIGNFGTKRFLPLCESGASCAGPDYTHTHPYMTPDNCHIIYCSDRTGICHTYAAAIPEGFLKMLGDDETQ